MATHAELSGQTHAVSDDPWKYLWSHDQDAVLPFQERAFSLIAWRDPVGSSELRAPLLARFQDYARERGKHAVVIGVSEHACGAGRQLGYDSTWVGSEPFFDLTTWNARGKSGERVRLASNHARRLGCSAAEAWPLRERDAHASIAEVERAWKAARAARNNASFLRTAPMEDAEARRYFVVRDADARMQAFIVCSRIGPSGWYLQDLVRHPNAPRGVTELGVLKAMATLGENGCQFVSMGIVPFLRTDTDTNAQPRSPVIGAIVKRLDSAFGFSGLQQFRKKFSPSRWEQIYVLCWPRVLTPLVGWEIASIVAR